MISFKRLLLILFAVAHPTTAYAGLVHIANAQAGVDIRTDKVIHILGEIEQPMQQRFRDEMASLSRTPGDVIILINSPGGDADIGLDMIDQIKSEQAKGRKFICVAIENAHSMAFNLLTHCDVRLATSNTTFLMHKVRQRVSKDVNYTALMFKHEMEELQKTDAKFDGPNMKALGLSEHDYNLYADEETVWLAQTLLAKHYLQGFVEHR